MPRSTHARWWPGRRGATAAEFALVAVPATLMMYGVMEAAWQVATLAALDQAALRASRFGITGLASPAGRSGAPTCRSAAIPWYVSTVTGGFLHADRLTVTLNSYASFDGSTSRSGGTAGPGSGGQVVTYELTYQQPWLIGGVTALVAGADGMTYRSTLTIKNEPFDDAVC